MVKTSQNRLGYLLKISEIKNNIFIPKFYSPEIPSRINSLRKTHNLIKIGDLISSGQLSIATGDEIGKMAYGTGDIPFIRTSDISNWEIKSDPKQGVSEEIYQKYKNKQDVRAGDIFFVRDGTYLIGQSCMVTDHDLPCLYQSHILKLRICDSQIISSELLLACLNTSIVKQQIRANQFTADIIDTIGNRFREIIIPIPRNATEIIKIENEVKDNISNRSKLLDTIRKIPLWTEGMIKEPADDIPEDWTWRVDDQGNAGFSIKVSKIKSQVFLPKYYNPQIDRDLSALGKTHELVVLGDLVKKHIISWETGIEIGKMAYGTGSVPFIRTSDISNWELKSDPKQNVSEDIYDQNKQDVQSEDIFVVRDGTYLVGTSCIITKHDTKILYCGGIYKLRVMDRNKIDPYLLLALLNTPIVRRQMRAKQFTRDIIDTLGKRLFEIILPIPKDKEQKIKIAAETKRVMDARIAIRSRSREIPLNIEGISVSDLEELEASGVI